MRTQRMRVMLLVDADNVSPDVMEQAMEAVLHDHGAAHIRRAYCTPESAVKNAALFKRLSLRPMVNLSTGKNATDIALAIDALDLAIAERPEVAVIVSSDSDFAPLVLRLREKGCRVEGIGQQGKTGEASKAVYDAFLDLVHRKAGATRRSAMASPRGRAAGVEAPAGDVDLLLDLDLPEAPRPQRATRTAASRARGTAAAASLAAPAVAPSTGAAGGTAGSAASAVAPAARKSPARRRATAGEGGEAPATPGVRRSAQAPDAAASAPAAPVPPTAPARRKATPGALPEAVEAILKAVPPLAAGQPVALGIAAERLRAAGLLARNAASTRLFARHARHFLLAPAGQPNTVQFVPD